MRLYEIPEIRLSKFESENIVTQSGGQPTAMDQAKTAAEGLSESQHTFTVNF